jgi:hypothetical protein
MGEPTTVLVEVSITVTSLLVQFVMYAKGAAHPLAQTARDNTTINENKQVSFFIMENLLSLITKMKNSLNIAIVPRMQDALFIVFLLSYQTAVTKGLVYLREPLCVRPLSKGFASVKDKIQWTKFNGVETRKQTRTSLAHPRFYKMFRVAKSLW